MGARRILVANEHTSYRQTIAMVLRELCAGVEVFEATPAALHEEVLCIRPDLVICSRATSLVREQVTNWIQLYPDCEPFSTLCIDGSRRKMDDVQLSELLSLCANSPL